MSKNHYKFKYDEYGNTREAVVYGSGSAVSSISFVNKGTAFNESERVMLGLQGSLPPGIRELSDQIENTRHIVDTKVDDIERFIFIKALFDRNVTLAHALIRSDLQRYMSIVYTPTIGQAVQRYSTLYRQAEGLHFYPGNIDVAEDILRRYLHRDIRIAVVTDNQGIPGMGDQGAGGIAVCLGKLMLYTQGAGIAPWHCLPISLDVGTDNQELLNDRRYLGWRNKRLKGEEYLSFIGRFVRAFRNVFPDAVCQWENLTGANAFGIRDAFADELISFNDNIQGTGAVALGAIISAMRAKKAALADQKFVIHGAGAEGAGICEQLELGIQEDGLSAEEARERIYLCDAAGLITRDRAQEYYLQKYAKDADKLGWGAQGDAVIDVIRKSKATVYINSTSTSSCLDRQLVKEMMANSDRPVIITFGCDEHGGAECMRDVAGWTGGKALFTSGGRVEPFAIEAKPVNISQVNTILVFPGIAQGVLASGAREILPEFFTAAARALANNVTRDELAKGCLLPPIHRVEKVSNEVALAVAMCAVKNGVSKPCVFSSFQHGGEESRMRELVKRMRWEPHYLPIVAM